MLNLNDYRDTKGNLLKAECAGHIQVPDFIKACTKEFKRTPFRINQSFRCFRKVPDQFKKGKAIGWTNKYVKCGPDVSDSEPVTVGYFV